MSTPNGGDGITVSIVADKAEFTEAEAQTFTVRLSEAVDRDAPVGYVGKARVRPTRIAVESAAASDGTAVEERRKWSTPSTDRPPP
ncbi:hypothetical protein GYM47_11845 [Vreelandella piezotolerans]|uniref:hypothetical protein n=1 Tax=Vreelandella piezotolerans TaxID=2609667 RepID=UPI0014449DCF|nr:hypothetical protein [Halomonas piezotolerans]QJA24739.1 hypothetical protein GYM47_11845 [Halomonas piezotolerans]